MKITGFSLTLVVVLANGWDLTGRDGGGDWLVATPPTALLEAPEARWHTIRISPKPTPGKIQFYQKLNPVWWLGNVDEPTPPDWYCPGDRHRAFKWYVRNPFHNFGHYVIGVADKKFYRSGKFPAHNAGPHGGWNFAVARRHIVLLPFVSYERKGFTFYLGWRERGNFGMKFNFHSEDKFVPEKNQPALVLN
jgi:hypothetical protein